MKDNYDIFEYIFGRDIFGKIFGKSEPAKIPNRDHVLKGDNMGLEPIEVEGKPAIRIHLPRGQVATVEEKAEAQLFRYDSPTDNGKRVIRVYYYSGHCRMSIS